MQSAKLSDTERQCRVCGLVKGLEEMRPRKQSKQGRDNECKDCARERNRVWRNEWRRKSPENLEQARQSTRDWRAKQEPEALKVRQRGYQLRSSYGLTTDDYAELLLAQGGVCACCQQDGPGARELCVDHDHQTGRVRGLLCSQCNTAVGLLKEDLDRVLAVHRYLVASCGHESKIKTLARQARKALEEIEASV